MEKTYIKLGYERYYEVEDFTDSVYYLSNRLDYKELVEKIEKLLELKEVEFKPAQSLLNFYKKEKYNLNNVKKDLSESYFCGAFEDDLKVTDKLEDILTTLIDWYGLEDYLYEIFSDKELEQFISSLGLQFGTVGYSQWSYYIAFDSIEHSFISDIYEGDNIYHIAQFDESGEVIDGLSMVYLTDDEELTEIVNNHLNVENMEVYLVDNDASQYFNAYPKVQQVTHRTYTFETI